MTLPAYTPQGLQLALGWEQGTHFVLVDMDGLSIVHITLVNCHGWFEPIEELVLEWNLFLPILEPSSSQSVSHVWGWTGHPTIVAGRQNNTGVTTFENN